MASFLEPNLSLIYKPSKLEWWIKVQDVGTLRKSSGMGNNISSQIKNIWFHNKTFMATSNINNARRALDSELHWLCLV